MLTEKHVLNELRSALAEHNIDFLPGENVMVIDSNKMIGVIFVDVKAGKIIIRHRVSGSGAGKGIQIDMADPTCFDQVVKIAADLIQRA